MKKIVNWVGGSFFRTLGRYLFYIFVGSLFYLLISKLNLFNFNYIVKAEEVPFESSYTHLYFKFNPRPNDPQQAGQDSPQLQNNFNSDWSGGASGPYLNAFYILFNYDSPSGEKVNIKEGEEDKYIYKSNHMYTLTFKFMPSKNYNDFFPLPNFVDYMQNDKEYVIYDMPIASFELFPELSISYTNRVGTYTNDGTLGGIKYMKITTRRNRLTSYRLDNSSPTPAYYHEIYFTIKFVPAEDLQAIRILLKPNIGLYKEVDGEKQYAMYFNFATVSLVSFTYDNEDYVPEVIPGGGGGTDTPDPDNPDNPQEDTTNKEILDYITDDSSPDISGLGDVAGYLPAGPVDSLLNLPLTFITNVNNALSGTCRPLELNIPFVDKKLTLPCLNTIYEKINGLSIAITSWSIVASAFILYSYFMYLYRWVDTLMTMDDVHLKAWGII